MSDASKAVFLSYASQDAEAARKICESLRSAGVEVWFDADGGLEHGDEWDAKIRRQIKECVLFIPLVSANTQARHEGYFRIEWELAAQRAWGIASGVAFILPVVIDDTREPEALVPDRFRVVQWTRLHGGEMTPEIKARFLKLWSHRTGVLRHEAASPAPVSSPVPAPSSAAGKWAGIAAAGVLLAAGAWFWTSRSSVTQNPEPKTLNTETTAPLSEAKRLVRQAHELTITTEISLSELNAAGLLCEKAFALDKSDPEVWAIWSEVETAMIHYGRDFSPERRESARTKTATAIKLDPNSFEARRARSYFLVVEADIQADRKALAEAEPVLRALRRERPRDPWTLLVLGRLLVVANRVDRSAARLEETAAVFDEMAALPGQAATAFSEKGYALYDGGSWAEAEVAADRSIAIQPFTGNVALKVFLALHWHGDRDLALAALGKLPSSMLLDDRGLSIAVRVYNWRREPDKLLDLLKNTPRDWINQGPKAAMMGDARSLLGQETAAQNDWRQALTLVEAQLATQRNDAALLQWKAYLLEALGDTTAAAAVRALLGQLSVQLSSANGKYGRYDLRSRLVPAGMMLDAVEAGVRDPHDILYTPARLRLDPAYDKVRNSPRFQAALVLAEATYLKPEERVGKEVSAVEKSVAVLAFEDDSPAKDNESFSDGISEELLNVLGKVPNLKVVGRTSSFYFKGKQVPMADMAKQLNVAYFVEGSVRRMGDQVRITARLTKAADGSSVPLGSFDRRDLKDIFKIQDEIAGLIAENLSLKLGAASTAKTVNPEAFSFYLQGRQEWNLRTKASFDRAEELFNRALALDPGFARAHSGLADVWLIRGSTLELTTGRFDQRNSPIVTRALTRIDQALALDPNSAEAHSSLGLASYDAWNVAAAQRETRRAIELNPNYPSAHQMLGRSLSSDGRIDQALSELKLASELDPLSSRIMDNLGLMLKYSGRTVEALAAYDRSRELNPGNVQALLGRADVLSILGRHGEAATVVRGIKTDDSRYIASIAVVLARAGIADEAERLLPGVEKGIMNTIVLLALGKRAEAVTSIDPGSIRRLLAELILFDPVLDPIRNEPRFAQALATVGLTEAHARAQAWRAAHPAEKTR